MEGLDFELLGDMYRGLYQRAHVPRGQELATPARLGGIDCYTTQPGDALGWSASCEVQRPGTFAAHALWFDAVLAGDIRLSSRDPGLANHWGQTILPARSARAVTPGEMIELDVIFDDRGRFSLQWETRFQQLAQVSSSAFCGRERGDDP
jgi:hypothetical protein